MTTEEVGGCEYKRWGTANDIESSKRIQIVMGTKRYYSKSRYDRFVQMYTYLLVLFVSSIYPLGLDFAYMPFHFYRLNGDNVEYLKNTLYDNFKNFTVLTLKFLTECTFQIYSTFTPSHSKSSFFALDAFGPCDLSQYNNISLSEQGYSSIFNQTIRIQSNAFFYNICLSDTSPSFYCNS